MPGELCVTKEPEGLGFFSEVYEAATSSIRAEPHGKAGIR
jgi:hypothetical protein